MSNKTHPRPAKRGKQQVYFFADMKIGDKPHKFPVEKYALVKSAATRIGKANGMKFTTRKEPDGVYVYRVKK